MSTIWTHKTLAGTLPNLSNTLRPLTGSIHQMLLSDVGQKIMVGILGNIPQNLNSPDTVTIHHHHLYFNLTLLKNVINGLGFSEQDLSFFIQENSPQKFPWIPVLRNLPVVFYIFTKDLFLEDNFNRSYRRKFTPILEQFADYSLAELSPQQVWQHIETSIELLKEVTRYHIAVSLSLGLRKALCLKNHKTFVKSQTLENRALKALASLAYESRNLLPMQQLFSDSCPALFAYLADIPDGKSVLAQFNQWLSQYGYLSEQMEEIAVHRWQENPRPVRELFAQFLLDQACPLEQNPTIDHSQVNGLKATFIEHRLVLQSQIEQVYAQLLAHLRWQLIALEHQWLESKILNQEEDIFFLEFSEIRALVYGEDLPSTFPLTERIIQRRSRFEQDQQLDSLPEFIYT